MHLVFGDFEDGQHIRHLPEFQPNKGSYSLGQPKVCIGVEQDKRRQSINSPCSAIASCMGMSITCWI